jgi:hypothetical protein
MSTTAKLFIDDLPEVGDGVRRYLVDCKWSTTRLIFCPGGDLELTQEQLVTVVLQRLEDECGKCNLNRLWQHADLGLKRTVNDAWRRLGALAIRERRN